MRGPVPSTTIHKPTIKPIKLKICFVTHNIYPVLMDQNEIKSAGGAELQQRFIGEALVKRGHRISYISMDVGQNELEVINGLKIYRTYRLNQGIRGFRFIYPVLYKIWKALKRANADIYYVRCAGFLPGIAAQFCRAYKRKMIYAGAHDTDFIPSQFLMKKTYEKIFFKYGLARADAIIVQSNRQKATLKKHFGLEGEVIRNFFPYPPKQISKSAKDIILWVSTLRSWKNPMRFVRLAKKFPEKDFVMIGGKPGVEETQLYDEVKKNASELKNLQFLGYQPFYKTEDYFDRCKLFVNTSDYEGFPNTFLQAWNRGVPVLSYVDPDRIIAEHNLGMVVTSEEELEEAFNAFITRPSCNFENITNYFDNHHSENVIEKYDDLFNRIV